MSAALLLEHYARIADAPDAISRLRRFVLDLAVRGKLVEQDAGDEPASELLERIATEKARLVKVGTVRDRAALPAVKPQDAPYSLPSSWMWVRFANIVEFYAGRTPARNDLSFWNTGDHAWVSIADMEDGGIIQQTKETVSDIARTNVFKSEPEPAGTMVMSFKLTIGKIARLGVPAFHNEAIISIHPHLAPLDGYLFMSLPELARAGDTRGAIKGATLNRDSLSNILVPLPPLAEQHRIVAKVDELMALCDQLEAARAEREAARDTFTLSTLAKLNIPDPETFGNDARFALANLAPLTIRPDQIKQLRQTILNLAVRGKLVEQDVADEPVEGLVQRIQRPIQELAQSLRLKVPQLPSMSEDQAPFELPVGWCWARFPELGAFGRGRSKHRPRNDPALYSDGEHRMIQTGDVARSKGLIQTHTAKYNDVGLAQSRLWPNGTLCITIAANIADSGILDFAACFPDSVVGFVPAPCFENARYFEYFMRTAKADLLAFAPATAQKNINLDILMQVMIPLPPLAEQHRIVAKVDELMALCDQLEASLITGGQTRSGLLEAVLHNALEPA